MYRNGFFLQRFRWMASPHTDSQLALTTADTGKRQTAAMQRFLHSSGDRHWFFYVEQSCALRCCTVSLNDRLSQVLSLARTIHLSHIVASLQLRRVGTAGLQAPRKNKPPFLLLGTRAGLKSPTPHLAYCYTDASKSSRISRRTVRSRCTKLGLFTSELKYCCAGRLLY